MKNKIIGFFIFSRRNYNIPVCIVDEAAQIQELDTLKVVAFKGNTLVLMGDKYKFPALDIPLVSFQY